VNFLPNASLQDDEYYSALLKRITGICGEVCTYPAPTGKGKFFGTVKKATRCEELFTEDMDNLDGLSNRWPPPRTLPEAMRAGFTMGHAGMPTDGRYLKQDMGSKPRVWRRRTVDELVRRYAKHNLTLGSYGPADREMIYKLMHKYRAKLAGRHCAVVGSQKPWVEALLLAVGVANVTTVEYGDIRSESPAIRTMHPSELGKLYKASGASGAFDCVVSYSSLEHAGLGRYGDIVNPWGDIIAIEKYKCMAKPGSLLLLGMPAGSEDRIHFNSMRRYGPNRWAQMLAGMEQLEYEHPKGTNGGQAMVVARKP